MLGFDATFLLVLLLNHYFAEKKSGKNDLILPIGLGGFEMVLTLLAKMITIEI